MGERKVRAVGGFREPGGQHGRHTGEPDVQTRRGLPRKGNTLSGGLGDGDEPGREQYG